MMTTLPVLQMTEITATKITALAQNPNWSEFQAVVVERYNDVVDLMIEGDPAMNEFYKGALFALREAYQMDTFAEEFLNTVREHKQEDGQ
jgi:hypothetical protein